MIAVSAEMIYEAQRRFPADVREYTLDSLVAQDNPYRRLLSQVLDLPNSIPCAIPGCTVHPQHVPGGKLQHCGECRRVQYGSRECQKGHWKAAEYPHKAVCLQIKALPVYIPFDVPIDAYDQFMEVCENMLTPQEADNLAMQTGPLIPPTRLGRFADVRYFVCLEGFSGFLAVALV